MRKIKHFLTRKGFWQGYVLLLKNKYLYRNVEKLKKKVFRHRFDEVSSFPNSDIRKNTDKKRTSGTVIYMYPLWHQEPL